MQSRLDQIKDLRGAMWKAKIEESNEEIFKKRIIKSLDEETLIKLEAGDVEFKQWVEAQEAEKEDKKEKRQRVKGKVLKIKNNPNIDPDVKDALEVLIEEALK